MVRPTIDDFTRGYLTAALWTEDPDPRSGEFSERDGWEIAAIDPASLAQAIEDCRQFQASNQTDLVKTGADDHRNGADFWLTRNGHGAGFWARGYGAVGERLTRACKRYPERYCHGPETQDNGSSSDEQMEAWDGVIYIE